MVIHPVVFRDINPCPAEPGYTLPSFANCVDADRLKPTKKPTDLDLQCLPLSL